MLYTLCYVSRAQVRADSLEMRDILDVARTRNATLGITGALYFDDVVFFQVLEGDEQALLDVYGSIQRDVRHEDVRLLKFAPLTRRRFEQWSMKFAPAHALPPEAPRTIRHAIRPGVAATAVEAAVDALR